VRRRRRRWWGWGWVENEAEGEGGRGRGERLRRGETAGPEEEFELKEWSRDPSKV